MIDEPQIVSLPAQPAAVIRLTIPRAKISEVMQPAMREVLEAVAAQGLKPAGPVFSHHFTLSPEIFDFEVGVPVSKAFTPAGRVKAGELPAATVAQTVYHGGYEGLGQAWHQFERWIAQSGHMPARDLWECYQSGPAQSPDPDKWRTELNRPLVD